MNFFRKNLEETINALNNLIEQGDVHINVKKVRKENKIKSTDRSKINFYSSSLKYLAGKNILEENAMKKTKLYNILTTYKITIDDIYP